MTFPSSSQSTLTPTVRPQRRNWTDPSCRRHTVLSEGL